MFHDPAYASVLEMHDKARPKCTLATEPIPIFMMSRPIIAVPIHSQYRRNQQKFKCQVPWP